MQLLCLKQTDRRREPKNEGVTRNSARKNTELQAIDDEQSEAVNIDFGSN
jgi:hypothetical protein